MEAKDAYLNELNDTEVILLYLRKILKNQTKSKEQNIAHAIVTINNLLNDYENGKV